MTPEQDAILSICMAAALADGARSAEERQALIRIAAGFGAGDADALAARLDASALAPEAAAAQLGTPDARREAYELAVAMIYADGVANPEERAFLLRLQGLLDQPAAAVTVLHQGAESLAQAPLAGPAPAHRPAAEPEGLRPSQAGIPAVSHDAALDALIRQQALLAGALELLPQGLASLAILPIQMRLVYRIGLDYGHKLRAEQVKDLLGVLGIGAAGQVFDGLARRLLGGLGRGLFGGLGGVLGGAAGMAAGAGVAFVTTYALGQAARQYYAQGRQLSSEDLRALFQRFRSEAEALLPRVQDEIRAQSGQLDLPHLLAALKGTAPTA